VGRLSDAEAAARIAADEIDVLIDLAGHTYGARPGIVARRPSPIQVSYFGFPGTTGAHYHDYAMVDPIVVPKGADVGFTEALARLTGCYFPFDTREPPPGIRPERASLGLPERAVVLACFNQVYKIQPRTFALWMKVLAAAPDAVLWLLDPGPIARENLQRGAENASVRSSRLIFAPPAPRPAHLLRCSAADLAIDTLPYNAHSTAMDVLAVGCPMVAMLGNDFAGRVSASVLHAVGLSDLIAPDERTSLSLMIELATDRTRLASVRDRLVRRLLAGPLFDMNRLCRDIESAVLEMHRRHADGEPARSFDLSSGVNGR
jgi:predicted O-linked N-acetylglucosamine transferase (SPINDLY family)